MANQDHMKILNAGVKAWNRWRIEYPGKMPNLSGANLTGITLFKADFSLTKLIDADLTGATLIGTDFSGAILINTVLRASDLAGANLSGANLEGADLNSANLLTANLSNANLTNANLSGADLSGANLFNATLQNTKLARAKLTRANFSDANLAGVDVTEAIAYHTVFTDIDLRELIGIESVKHLGPSEVSVSTIYRSEGQIPEVFLRDCGLPESFISQIPQLIVAMQPIQFYSCFVSYSGKDEEFARRLHSRMREANLRVWFASEDMKGGDKIYDQIDRAIQVHDRLLLVLSESSMQSKWVETEIRSARKVELREGRRKLFPIRLVSYEALQVWVCLDSTTGENLAEEVRSYFIPDFSNWKNHDDLEQAFARLLADLKASA